MTISTHPTGGITQVFIREFATIGYDRFSVEGDVFGCICRLWRKGETISKLHGEGATLELAMQDALGVARMIEGR